MKLVLFAMIAAIPSCSFCGKTTSAPAPDASVAPAGSVASWPPSAFDGSRPCVTTAIIAPSKIAPYFDIEDEFDREPIVAMGESAVAPLIALTHSPRDQERGLATSVLGSFPCREAVARLEELLQDPDDGLRLGAVLAFVRSLGSAATPQLSRMLRDRDASVQHHVVQELKRVGDSRALGPLATLRDSAPQPWVRERAAGAILAIATREADAGMRDR